MHICEGVLPNVNEDNRQAANKIAGVMITCKSLLKRRKLLQEFAFPDLLSVLRDYLNCQLILYGGGSFETFQVNLMMNTLQAW